MKASLTALTLSMALVAGGCSASLRGSYEGTMRVGGIIDGASWDDTESNVIALVEGSGDDPVVDFGVSTIFNNCSGVQKGAVCKVDIKGSTTDVAIQSVVIQSREKTVGPGAVFIEIQGTTPAKNLITCDFTGKPYGQK